MDGTNKFSGIWFVYDGDCPVCGYAAQALRIKEEFGELHLLDARVHLDHAVVRAVTARGLDLDEGMVIVHGDNFHHGKTALRFMAQYGERRGLFNHLNRLLFQSHRGSALIYPWLRAGRNLLLRVRGKRKIGNLQRQDQSR